MDGVFDVPKATLKQDRRVTVIFIKVCKVKEPGRNQTSPKRTRNQDQNQNRKRLVVRRGVLMCSMHWSWQSPTVPVDLG